MMRLPAGSAILLALSACIYSHHVAFASDNPRLPADSPQVPSHRADSEPVQVVDRFGASWRVPVDVCWLAGSVFTANSKTGTISRIDDNTSQVSHEWKVADQLSGLTVAANQLIALDCQNHSAIVLDFSQSLEQLTVSERIPIPQDPVSLTVSDEQHVAIASRWSHQVTLLHPPQDSGPDHESHWQQRWIIDLSFAPHTMLFVPDNKLIVCDAFGGRSAVIDCTSGTVLNTPQLYGHNIRGLCLSADGQKLHVTHQNLNHETFTSYERVFWGVVMQNAFETRQLSQFLAASESQAHQSPSGNLSATYGGSYNGSPNYSAAQAFNETTSLSSANITSTQTYPLGTPSVGSGDPSEIVITKSDTTLLLLSGFNQVAYRTASHLPFLRLKVGRRPEAICLNDQQTRAYVANRFDESVSVIDLSGEAPQLANTVSLGPARELTSAERGEQLFFDASLSLDGWYSCHSCHTDGHTNDMLADTLGDEGQGAPKKVLSLLGTRDTAPWAWTGGKTSLEDQIKTSLIISMQTTLRSEDLPISELAAYLRTLEAPPSVESARTGAAGSTEAAGSAKAADAEQFKAGRREFEAQGCIHCHAGQQFTSDGTYEVGLSDNMGNTLFNPPSLRGISQRSRYFHDGSAETLDDVLKSNHHGSESTLTPAQSAVLKKYLESL